MKISILLFILIFFSSISFGQKKERYEPKFILKSNPLSLLESSLEVSLEFKSAPHKSNQITLKIIENGSMLIGSFRPHNNREYISGFGLAFERRNYSEKTPALRGFYYGYYAKIHFLSSKVFPKYSGDYYSIKRNAFGSGISGGWQFAHRYIFPTIDINIAIGLLYSPYPFTSEHEIDVDFPLGPEIRLGINFGFGY